MFDTLDDLDCEREAKEWIGLIAPSNATNIPYFGAQTHMLAAASPMVL
jgi:hypothetical protein